MEIDIGNLVAVIFQDDLEVAAFLDNTHWLCPVGDLSPSNGSFSDGVVLVLHRLWPKDAQTNTVGPRMATGRLLGNSWVWWCLLCAAPAFSREETAVSRMRLVASFAEDPKTQKGLSI